MRVAVVTGGRADWGLLRPTVHALAADARFEPLVVAAAMHLEARYGDTLAEIDVPVAATAGASAPAPPSPTSR